MGCVTAKLVRLVTLCAALHWEAPGTQPVLLGYGGLPALYLLWCLAPGTTQVGSTGLDPPRLPPLSLLNLFQKKIKNPLKGKCN